MTSPSDNPRQVSEDITTRLRRDCMSLIADEAADTIDRLRAERDEARRQRDEVRLQTGRILNEIECRIEHGAESNGHLEAIRNMFKENTND